MRPMIAIGSVLIAIAAMSSDAVAQRRDAGDRGLRLEHDAMRSDVRQNRLKQPATPPPAWETETKAEGKAKRKKD